MLRSVDVLIGIVCFSASMTLFVLAPQHAKGMYPDGIQPWFFPRIVLGVLALLSVILVWMELRRWSVRGGAGEIPRSGVSSDADAFRSLENRLVPTFLVIGYIFLIYWLGFLVSTFIVTSSYMLFLRARLMTILAVSLTLPVTLYYLFGMLLQIPLPVNRLIIQ